MESRRCILPDVGAAELGQGVVIQSHGVVVAGDLPRFQEDLRLHIADIQLVVRLPSLQEGIRFQGGLLPLLRQQPRLRPGQPQKLLWLVIGVRRQRVQLGDGLGGGLEIIVKQKGSGGTADPLDQRSSVGWKAIKTAELLVPNYLVRVESISKRFSEVAEAN